MRRIRTALATGLLATALLVVAACGSSGKSTTGAASSSSAAAPSATVTVTASPTPTPTVTVTPNTVTATPPPVVTVTPTPTPSAPATVTRSGPQLTNAAAVVQQYYQDITNHDYAAAWALGGSNIAGSSYAQYVAGFATTASISLGTVSQFNSSQVQAVLYATQTDGTVKVFQGTYTVTNGVLTGASIQQIH
ncbi:hypothetical protein C7C46_32000 [Streptomyces tateyamensis]|uniref:SnoaL-like domain-containing protein n=1 Tax=Streptomyces tateyamensis TaxID=565073 RepID=A0A2V4MSS0_9ACTN|nr:hypothetical protein [Streptomyces tateyamensis]PYC65898.1 hypothetical protein C7C46_32000 [Streptomyces tateyamensis]